ncbi:MAG: hypothetical protein V3W14_03410 [Candidatus Neomarinimicrobiota bacterium]
MSVATVIQSLFRLPPLEDRQTSVSAESNWRPWGSGLFSIDDIRTWVGRRSTEFQHHLLALLYDHTIPETDNLVLQINGGGQITLVSPNSSRDAIEGLLNGSRVLRHLFYGISATAGFLRSVDENPDFQELYGQNPEVAVARYGQLHAQRSQYEFQITVTPNTVTFGFVPAIA